MCAPIITSVLSQAGVQLLNILLDYVQTGNPGAPTAGFAILENLILAAIDTQDFETAFNETQEHFKQPTGSYTESHDRMLQVFSDLLEYAGPERDAFARNLWRAYLFQSPQAATVLWDQYPAIQQAVTIETGRPLPPSWGDWVIPMSTFFGIAEQHLAARCPEIEELITLPDCQDLVEDLPYIHAQPDTPMAPQGPIFTRGHLDLSTLTTYLNHCLKHIGHIDPRGYPRSTNRTVPISDVYLPLRLIALTDYEQPAHYVRYQTLGYKDDPYLHIFRMPIDRRELDNHKGQTISDTLVENPLVLILGENGTGKTTVLRHLAYQHARVILNESREDLSQNASSSDELNLPVPLPIYVDLAEYVEHRQEEETLEAYILRTAELATNEHGVYPLLEKSLRQGSCLLLLDGLDQVASDEQRRMLSTQVSEASLTWQADGNNIIVTSRLIGYDVAPLPQKFAAYLLKPLDRNQISTFLLQWRLSLDLRQRPLRDKDAAMRQAEQDTMALVRMITKSQRLYTLVNTPLMLRMLVGVYRPGMQLAPTRAAVYQLIADTLIQEWRLPQAPSNQPVVLEHEVTALLGELAAWLQSSRPTGIITEYELREILTRIWQREHPNASPEQAVRAISTFIGTLRVHAGVLIELAPERYGFIFQGLQEYFAARYLVYRYQHAAERIREHLHDPLWDEVISLAIGYTSLSSIDNASDLIETAILSRGTRAGELFGNAASLFESLLKRDLFLAARLLASGVEVRPELAMGIVRKLMELWLYGDHHSLGRFNMIFDGARRHLISLDGTSASRFALQIAKDNLLAPSEYAQAYAVDALTFWSSYQDEAQRALIGQEQKAPLMVRRAVASALGRLGRLNNDAYAYLLNLTADTDEKVRDLSQQAIKKYPSDANYSALNIWVDFLNSDDPVRQRVSLRRLHQIGALPGSVTTELLHMLDDPDPTLKERAAETLAGISNLPDDAMTVLCRAIAEADASFRARAIEAFVRPVTLPPQVIAQLVAWADDPNGRVRTAALMALGTCNNTETSVIDALVEGLDDPSDSLRAAVVEPLIRKAGDDLPYILHQLSHHINDAFYQVRMAIASALRYVNEPSEELHDMLFLLLRDREMLVKRTTLETLCYIKEPGEGIITYLVDLAGSPEHHITRSAVRTLAAQRGLTNSALMALTQALPVYGDDLGEDIVTCLQAHTPLSSEIINYLMDLAVSSPVGAVYSRRPSENVQALAIKALGYALPEAPAVLQVLLSAAEQQSSIQVRAAALASLGYTRTVTPRVMRELTNALKSGSLETRCAAGIALGMLVRDLPDPPLTGNDLLDISRDLSDLLTYLPQRAAWDQDTETQNKVLRSLSWVAARTRPTLPRLMSRSENPRGYLD